MRLSLRLRLVLLPALVVAASIVLLGILETRDARVRVAAESESGMQLGRNLVQNALASIRTETDPELARVKLLTILPQSLRHVSIVIVEPGGEATTDVSHRAQAPMWFTRLVATQAITQTFQITVAGQDGGQIILASRPSDEIAEVWTDWRAGMAVLAAVSVMIILVILVALGLALRPLTRLTEALDRLEAGDFTTRVRGSSDPQLQRLTQRFNSLAASLEQVNADNRHLVERLMTVQEEERKEVAAELHDEIGPSLFAIRADIGAISRWTRQPGDVEAVRDRLTSISTLVTQLQKINSRLLERLRPLVLDQMPLAQALLALAEAWRNRHPETELEAVIDQGPELPEERRLAVYLAAREALTNVARHAEAHRVRLLFQRGDAMAVLTIEDDGKGMPVERRRSYGLLGMAERARAAGGRAEVGPAGKKGTRVMVEVPEGRS